MCALAEALWFTSSGLLPLEFVRFSSARICIRVAHPEFDAKIIPACVI